MNLDTMAAALAADTTLDPRLVIGLNLFTHHMPGDKKTGVMLREYFGGTGIDHEMPKMRQTSFQCIVRSPVNATGRAIAQAISELWTFENDPLNNPRVIGDMSFMYLRPRAEPLVFPLSTGSLWEFLVNFDACYTLD